MLVPNRGNSAKATHSRPSCQSENNSFKIVVGMMRHCYTVISIFSAAISKKLISKLSRRLLRSQAVFFYIFGYAHRFGKIFNSQLKTNLFTVSLVPISLGSADSVIKMKSGKTDTAAFCQAVKNIEKHSGIYAAPISDKQSVPVRNHIVFVN